MGLTHNDGLIQKTCYPVFGLSAIVLNVLEIWLISRKGIRKTCFEMILVSLSFADIISGVIFLGSGISSFFDTFLTSTFYGEVLFYSLALNSIGLSSSILHIVLITLERIIAVYFPLKLKFWITKTRTKFSLLTIWCTTVAICILLYFFCRTNKELIHKVAVIFFSIVILIGLSMAVVYTLIARKIVTALRQRRQRLATLHQQEATNSTSNSKREGLIVINSAIVILCFLLCNVPMAVHQFLKAEKFFITAGSFMALNPMLDPIIYFHYSYLIKKKRCKQVTEKQTGNE